MQGKKDILVDVAGRLAKQAVRYPGFDVGKAWLSVVDRWPEHLVGADRGEYHPYAQFVLTMRRRPLRG